MRPIDADALLKDGIHVSCSFNDNGMIMVPMGDVRRSIENAPTLDLAKMNIYLIYKDDMDDCCQIKGCILGTEEDTDRYVEDLNKDAEYSWDEWTWECLEKLN